MTDVDDGVRAGLQATRLPSAPPELRQFVAELALRPPAPRWSRLTARRTLIAVPAVLLLALAVGISTIATGPRPRSTVGPSATPTASGPAAAGLRQFTAPGISFLYPEAWTTQAIPTDFVDTWSHRYIGFLSDGPPECWLVPTPPLASGSAPPCTDDGQVPGSLQLHVSEYTHPVPGESNYGRPVGFALNPAYEMATGLWWVTDPGGGIYQFHFSTPYAEPEGHRDEIVALIKSITFTDWDRPSLPSTDGRVQFTSGFGTLTYPDTWARYNFMPWYNSMVGLGPFLLIASKPLEPCIPADRCHLADSEGAIVIEASEVSGVFELDWSTANTHIGGHTAIKSAPAVDNGIQHLGWRVQLSEASNAELDIDVAMPTDSDPALRRQLDEFLAGITLQDAAPTDAP